MTCRASTGSAKPGANRRAALDDGGQVDVGAVGTWQYAQSTCLPAGCAARIGRGRLHDKHERPLRNAVPGDVALAGRDLVQGAAEVDGCRPGTRGSRQGTGPSRAQSDLEERGAVAEPPEPAPGTATASRSPATSRT